MVILTQLRTGDMVIEVFLVTLALFLLGAMLGYLIEVLFRRFFTVHRWVNPGFMKGPWLPMYGFGLITMFYLSWLILAFMPKSIRFYNPMGGLFYQDYVSGPTIADLIPISLMALSMILIELFAGLVFVKGFKVKLWDYSNMKGNFQGIICPLFNLIWFALAVLYYYAINPFLFKGFTDMFVYMFGDAQEGVVANFGFLFLLGVAYGIFFVDLVSSIGLFNKVRETAKKSGVVERYEKLREESRKVTDEAKKRFFDRLPEKMKERMANNRKEDHALFEKVYEAARKAVLIDPEKQNTKENYDSQGRPIKEEDTPSKEEKA